jgi:hypothetical protein
MNKHVHELTLVGGTPSAGAVFAARKWIACVDVVKKVKRKRVKKWSVLKECAVWGDGISILDVWWGAIGKVGSMDNGKSVKVQGCGTEKLARLDL